jgi:hypothetical protein
MRASEEHVASALEVLQRAARTVTNGGTITDDELLALVATLRGSP